MASFGSTIDDPEKHFLGNLLSDDDPALVTTPNTDAASGIPPVAVISGTGPSGSSFWPEPPPPYSASVSMPSWSPLNHNINHVLQQPLKEPSHWDSLLCPDPYTNESIFNGYPPQQPYAPGHLHAQPHQSRRSLKLGRSSPPRTSTHFSQEFSRDSDSPEPACPTPDPPTMGTSQSGSVRSSSSSLSNRSGRSSRFAENEIAREQQLTPPPPEPIHKLPFSYRDVAGRGAVSTSGHQSVNQRNSAPISSGNTVPQQLKQRLGSASSVLADFASNKERDVYNLFQDEKSKNRRRINNTENEFQKVPRKKGQVVKIEKVAHVQPVIPDCAVAYAPPVVLDAASRWDVLSTLSPHKDGNKETTDVNNVSVEETNFAVRRESRTSSIGDGDNDFDRLLPRRGPKKIVKNVVEPVKRQKPIKKKNSNELLDKLTVFVAFLLSYAETSVKWFLHLLSDVILTIYGLFTHFLHTFVLAVCVLIRNSYMGCLNYFSSLLTRLRRLEWNCLRRNEELDEFGRWGLEQSIQLPSTGDEAISRLLRCRGQDAYVILGLRADAPDDEINRYYKRQSLLIHPDKNPSECAEEAFLVIQKAYEIIGNPDERKKYNLVNLIKNPLHVELEELWDNLRIKVDEVRSTMHCDCGERHTRIHMENMKAIEGRYCSRCECRHPAKQNDIWVESKLFGFVWAYYTCVEGQVYDISHWANCENNQLKHIRADAHSVQYRLVSSVSHPPPIGKFSSASTNTRGDQDYSRDEVCMPPDVQQLTYQPPDRSSDDRPRKGSNRRHRKAR